MRRRGCVVSSSPAVSIVREIGSRRGGTHVYRGQPFPPGIAANEDVPAEELIAASMHASAISPRKYTGQSGDFTIGFWMAQMVFEAAAPKTVEQWAGWLAFHIQQGESSP